MNKESMKKRIRKLEVQTKRNGPVFLRFEQEGYFLAFDESVPLERFEEYKRLYHPSLIVDIEIVDPPPIQEASKGEENPPT